MIETVSVPRTRKYNQKNRPNQSMSNNLIDVQQMKNVYNRETNDKAYWISGPFLRKHFL